MRYLLVMPVLLTAFPVLVGYSYAADTAVETRVVRQRVIRPPIRVRPAKLCLHGGCRKSRWGSGCPDGYSCYPLYGAYGPYGGASYWGAYTGWVR
jgi:hypothetical protein